MLYLVGDMMRITRIVAITAIGLGFGTGALHAQDLGSVQAPAEVPPASYRSAQYVDSNGCVFIRAGIDGNINWVPRVNRQRELICGQTPTLSGTQRAIAPDPTPPVVAQPAPPVPAPQPAPQATAPRQVATATPAPQPRPAPAAVVRRPAPVAKAPAPRPAPPVVRKAADVAPAQPNVSPQTRVVPRHVYEQRQSKEAFPVPKGYRPVWDDDRLNPRRAEQSLEGIARTRFIWTQTVPRRLVNHATGEDVTAKVALVYPYTDIATQQRDLGTVTLVYRDGQLQKRIVRNKAKTRAPTVSTRSAPEPVVQAKTKVKASSKGRYVQVGTYGQPANAQAAAQRILRAGLPARIGKVKRGGKSYQVVLAGPFANKTSLGQGLRTSRAAGFGDAFIR